MYVFYVAFEIPYLIITIRTFRDLIRFFMLTHSILRFQKKCADFVAHNNAKEVCLKNVQTLEGAEFESTQHNTASFHRILFGGAKNWRPQIIRAPSTNI